MASRSTDISAYKPVDDQSYDFGKCSYLTASSETL